MKFTALDTTTEHDGYKVRNWECQMFVESQNSPASLLEHESNAWGLTVENGVHWFVAPNGEKFYGSGVNGVDAGSAPEEVDGRPAYYLWNLYPSLIISARGIFAWKKSASPTLPTSISDA